MADGDKESGWFSEDAATLGDRIAGAREAAGLSQKDLARRIGVKDSTVAKWEEDRADPRSSRIQMMAGMLGVSLSWLLTGRGDGPDEPSEMGDVPADMASLLDEVRRLRTEMSQSAIRLGQIETSLRRRVREIA